MIEQLLRLPACELQALTLLQQHRAGAATDWTQATEAMHELRTYTSACADLTKAITRIPPSPVKDADLLLTSML
jgi:hypothetical protein